MTPALKITIRITNSSYWFSSYASSGCYCHDV